MDKQASSESVARPTEDGSVAWWLAPAGSHVDVIPARVDIGELQGLAVESVD